MFVQPQEEPEELIAARAKLDSASLAQQENDAAGILESMPCPRGHMNVCIMPRLKGQQCLRS